MKKYLLSLLLCITFLCASGYSSADDDTVLAEFGDVRITQSDYDRTFEYYPEQVQNAIRENPEFQKRFLLSMVQLRVISDMAREKGIDKIPAVRTHAEVLVNDLLSKELMKREVLEKITITEEDKRSYYTANSEGYSVPETVRARHILIRVPADAEEKEKEELKKKAEAVLEKVRSGDDFERLASENSDDSGSKQKGGDVGFFPRGRMVKPFEDAAFSLKEGEVSGLVETKFGFHIIRVEERKEAQIKPFEEVKEEIQATLKKLFEEEKTTAFLDDAIKKAGVTFHFDRIKLD
jgi:peptidyl-prolyl cis-trans isomerase C